MIVRSTIELGHNMGLKVIAEGVESEECLRMRRTSGVNGQGFYFSRPLRSGAAGLVKESRWAPSAGSD